MPEYKVKRSHYTGKFNYKCGEDFPKEGDELPAEPELQDKIRRGLIEAKSDKSSEAADPPKKVEEATEAEVLAYLQSQEEAPTAKPKVGDLSEAMDKKVSGKTLDAAWTAFKDEGEK